MIKTKKESDRRIKELGLNRMLDGVFKKENQDELKAFLEKHPFPFYNMRDKSKAMGQFLYKITKDEVLAHSTEYELFSVYESLALADERLVLQGDVQITSDFELTASLSNIKGISNRVAMQNPVYHVTVDLKEHREPSISGLKEVVDYVIRHQLLDMVVEFTIFEIPVGINQENILIWELRNY